MKDDYDITQEQEDKDENEEERMLAGLSQFVAEHVNTPLQQIIFDPDSTQALEKFFENKDEDKPDVAKSLLQKILDYFSGDAEVKPDVTVDHQIQDMPYNVIDGSYFTTRDLLYSFITSSGSAIDSIKSLYRDDKDDANTDCFQYQMEEVKVDDPTVFKGIRRGYQLDSVTEDISDCENNSDRDRSISYVYGSDRENSNDLQPSVAVDPDDASKLNAMRLK